MDNQTPIQVNSTCTTSYDRIEDPNLRSLCETGFPLMLSLLEKKSFNEGKEIIIRMLKFIVDLENN